MNIKVETWQEAQALIRMDPSGLDADLRNVRHAALNQWMMLSPTGKLYERLVLAYAPLPIGMHSSKEPTVPGRLYIGGAPEGAWFYVDCNAADFPVVSSDQHPGG